MVINHGFRRLSIGLISGWLLLFVLLPNLLVLLVSLLQRDGQQLLHFAFSLDSYRRLFDPLYARILWNSLQMALIATLCCLLLAYPFARATARLPVRWRPVLLFLLILPFWTNSLIRTYALKNLLGHKGLINDSLLALGLIDQPLVLLNTSFAVMLGLVYILLPFMVLPLYASIEKLDPRLLEAAQDLGASRWQRFLQIEWPLAQPGVIAGCLLVFLPAMGMFYVSDLLGGAKQMLVGNLIQNQFLKVRDWPFGAAASLTLTLLLGLMLLAYWRAARAVGRQGGLDD